MLINYDTFAEIHTLPIVHCVIIDYIRLLQVHDRRNAHARVLDGQQSDSLLGDGVR